LLGKFVKPTDLLSANLNRRVLPLPGPWARHFDLHDTYQKSPPKKAKTKKKDIQHLAINKSNAANIEVIKNANVTT